MRSRGEGRRVAGVALMLSFAIAGWLTAAPVSVGGAVVTGTWSAPIGAAGANGSAAIRAFADGTGSISLRVAKMRPATSLAVVVSKGSCASVGPTLFALPRISTTGTGAAVRTSSLTAKNVALLAATSGAGGFAIRVGAGTSRRCGRFAARAAPRPTPSPGTSSPSPTGDDFRIDTMMDWYHFTSLKCGGVEGDWLIHVAGEYPLAGGARLVLAGTASATLARTGQATGDASGSGPWGADYRIDVEGIPAAIGGQKGTITGTATLTAAVLHLVGQNAQGDFWSQTPALALSGPSADPLKNLYLPVVRGSFCP